MPAKENIVSFPHGEYTTILLTAAMAGSMRLVTARSEISDETIELCAAFVAHFDAKAVSTEIHIEGKQDRSYYDKVITCINFSAIQRFLKEPVA